MFKKEIMDDDDESTAEINCNQKTQYYKFNFEGNINDDETNVLFTEEDEQTTQKFKLIKLDCVYQMNFQTMAADIISELNSIRKRVQKVYILNTDYDIQKFKAVEEHLADSSKGAYSQIDLVQDCHMRVLVRKKVYDQHVFQSELQFFQEHKNKYIINIHYYSEFAREFYLEKGDHTIQSFYRQHNIKDHFFTLTLCLTIVEAVNALHLSNIFHGDIKPHNIVLLKRKDFKQENIQIDFSEKLDYAQKFFKTLATHNDNQINNTKDKDIDQMYIMKQKEMYEVLQELAKQDRRYASYQTYTDILEGEYKLSLKFIDFQSSSSLNSKSKIKYFTNAFTNQKLLQKLKSNSRQLCVIDKILLDNYSCIRTLLLIAQNFNLNKAFINFQDKDCINMIQNQTLKQFLLSYLSIFDSTFQSENGQKAFQNSHIDLPYKHQFQKILNLDKFLLQIND